MAPTKSNNSFGDYGNRPILDAGQELANAFEHGLDASLFRGKANSFVCPLGDTPGRGYLLMMRKHVLELQEYLEPDRAATANLTIGIDGLIPYGASSFYKYLQLRNIVFIQATRVFPGFEEDQNTPMLVEVTDIRHWMKKSFIDTQYNVRCLTETTANKYWTPSLKYDPYNTGQYAETCQDGCRPWTWREILEDIWQHFPEEYQSLMPELPYQYDDLWDSVPERVTFSCMSALTAYCEALKLAGGAALGFDPSYDPIISSLAPHPTFFIVFPGGDNPDYLHDQLQLYYRQSLRMKQEVIDNSRAFIPEAIRVVFEAVYESREVEEFFLKPKYAVEIGYTGYLLDKGLNSDPDAPLAMDGTVEIINGKMDAIITGIDASGCDCPTDPESIEPQDLARVPDPDNIDDLEAYAKDIAYRFWDHRVTNEPTELLYEGCLPFRHGDRVFQVSWFNTNGRGYGWQTRVEYHRTLNKFFDLVEGPFKEMRSQAGCNDGSSIILAQTSQGIAKGSTGTVVLMDGTSPAEGGVETLKPDADGPVGAWSSVGGPGGLYATLGDSDDTTYVTTNGVNDTLWLRLPTINKTGVVVGIQFIIRCLRIDDLKIRSLRLYKNDRTTPLTGDIRLFQIPGGYAWYYPVAVASFSVSNLTHWTQPYLRIVTENSSGASIGEVRVAEVSVRVTWDSVGGSLPRALARMADVSAGTYCYLSEIRGNPSAGTGEFDYEIIVAEPITP